MFEQGITYPCELALYNTQYDFGVLGDMFLTKYYTILDYSSGGKIGLAPAANLSAPPEPEPEP